MPWTENLKVKNEIFKEWNNYLMIQDPPKELHSMFFSSRSWPWMTTELAITNMFYATIVLTLLVNLCV